MGMPEVSGIAQGCPAVLTTFLLAVDAQSSKAALLHYCCTLPEAKHNTMLRPASLANWHNSSNCFVGKRFNYRMRVECSSMSCVPSAQHSCNVQAVACINDASADLLVTQSCDDPHIR